MSSSDIGLISPVMYGLGQACFSFDLIKNMIFLPDIFGKTLTIVCMPCITIKNIGFVFYLYKYCDFIYKLLFNFDFIQSVKIGHYLVDKDDFTIKLV